MVKINMIEKISYYLARKIYMCSEADVTCAVDEKNEDVSGTSVWHRMHDKYEYSLYGYICVCMVF